MIDESRLESAVQFRKNKLADETTSKEIMKQALLSGKLSISETNDLLDSLPRFEIDKKYEVGDLLVYIGRLFEVIEEHTSLSDLNPDVSPGLFKTNYIDKSTVLPI